MDADEKRYVKLAMSIQDRGTVNKQAASGIDLKTFWLVIKDWQVYLMVFVNWSNVVPNYAMKFTLPTIITSKSLAPPLLVASSC